MAKQTRASARPRPKQRPAYRKPARMPTLPPPDDTIMRLHRAVLEELGVVEAMRAKLNHEPQNSADAERTARTLSSLAETLQKLQRLQCTPPETEFKDDDDMPADIDEFRNELARRIDEMVESWSDEGIGERSVAAEPVDPAQL
jgi:hypothetical protein